VKRAAAVSWIPMLQSKRMNMAMPMIAFRIFDLFIAVTL